MALATQDADLLEEPPGAFAGERVEAADPGPDGPGKGAKQRRKAMTWEEFKTSTRAAFEPENIKESFQEFGQKTKAAFQKLGSKMESQRRERRTKKGYTSVKSAFPEGYDPETMTFEVECMSKADRDKIFMRGYTEEDLRDPDKCKEILKLLDKKKK